MLDFAACRPGVPVALVGGLAVGARALERTTRDADFAVSVANDHEAEQLVAALRARGYVLQLMLEQTDVNRLSTVRLVSPVDQRTMVDILFASSGIEAEVAAAAELIDVADGVRCPVAQVGDLIALKVLSRSDRRPQDDQDIGALVRAAAPADIARARTAVRWIQERGYARGKNLADELHEQLRRWAAPTSSSSSSGEQ